MSQEDVEIVRAIYEPLARGDFSAWAGLPDDFEFVASPELPDAGTYHGEAAIRWMMAWVESFEGHTIEATEIVDAGGELARTDVFPDRVQALEAAGLRE